MHPELHTQPRPPTQQRAPPSHTKNLIGRHLCLCVCMFDRLTVREPFKTLIPLREILIVSSLG